MTLLSLFIFLTVQAADKRFGHATPHLIWDKKNISVCFADQNEQLKYACYYQEEKELKVLPLRPEQKRQIKKAVEISFKPKLTGIYFSGWDDCKNVPKGSRADVVVFVNEGKGIDLGAGGIGSPLKMPEGKKCLQNSIAISKGFLEKNNIVKNHEAFLELLPPSSKIQKPMLVNQLQNQIVHEFGHIAGLNHEHSRKSYFRNMSEVILGPTPVIEGLAGWRDLELLLLRDSGSKDIGEADMRSTMGYNQLFIFEPLEFIQPFCERLKGLTIEQFPLYPIYSQTAAIYRTKETLHKTDREVLEQTLCLNDLYKHMGSEPHKKYGYLSRGDVLTLSHLYNKTTELYQQDETDRQLVEYNKLLNKKMDKLNRLWKFTE